MKNFDFDKIPIVEIVNEILLDGVKKGASDIHFDPNKESITIRMRVDGTLYDYSVVPMEFKRNMVSRVKMIASMNIMETRLPQDGAIKSKIGDKMLDLRVSSLPTHCGEKVVLRILDYSKSLQGLETLGFSEQNLAKIFKMVEVPNGIVLVTGATGSGKSTTVYSILQRLNTREVNIITVEDPVEMDIEGLNQVQAQQEIGLDFASVLRSILRQDPDIIMIGEIRDGETASIAVRASITGHKVLSTIHTNSALNTIERLTDMGVERYLIGTSLSGIISQKLARKLCPHCRIKREPSDYEKRLFHDVLNQDVEFVYDQNTEGCDKCTKGFKNRIAIAEVLFINDDVRTGITNAVPKDEMRKLVYGHGNTHTLLQDGLEKVACGETSFEEILKLVDLENDLAIHKALAEEGLNDKSSELSEEEINKSMKTISNNKNEEKSENNHSQENENSSKIAPIGLDSHDENNNLKNNEVKDENKSNDNVKDEKKDEKSQDNQSEQNEDVARTAPMGFVPDDEDDNQNNNNSKDENKSNDNVNDQKKDEKPQDNQSEQNEDVARTAPMGFVPDDEDDNQNNNNSKDENKSNDNVNDKKKDEKPQDNQSEQNEDVARTAPMGFVPDDEDELETIELSAVIPPNNTAAAVNLNTDEIPKNLEMFQ